MEGDFATAQAAYAKQAEEQLEAEKEKRVAHLQQQAARRIANAGIASGFGAWQEQWEEKARQKRMLAAAGARLARPALAAALAAWRQDWAVEMDKRSTAALLANAGSEREALQAELDVSRAELQAALEAALADREAMAAQHLASLEAGGKAFHSSLEERLEEEREKRIVHLQQSAARRIANADIAFGFSTWQGQWAEAARQKRMLAAAGARLARPALAAALGAWRQDWAAEEEEKRFAAMGANERRQLAREQALHDELAAVREELEGAREALVSAAEEQAEATGSLEAAHQRQMAELAEGEAEQRIAHLQKQAARRIANAGSASGFTTWQEQWEEKARQKRMLAAAGARLARPALAAALAGWVADWRAVEQTQQAAAALLQHAAAADIASSAMRMQRRCSELEAEVQAVRSELGAALEQSQEEVQALQATIDEARVARVREREVAAMSAEEKHEQHLQRVGELAIRRIMQLALSRGWALWLDTHLEAQRQKRMLAAAGARLARPALAAALGAWRQDWWAEEEAKLVQAHLDVQSRQAGRSAELQAEMNNLRAELAAGLEAAALEQARLREEQRDAAIAAEEALIVALAEQEEETREQRVAHLQQSAARRIANRDISMGFGAWQEQWEEAARQKRMLAAAGARLARPALAAAVAGWVADWREAEEEREEARRLELLAAHQVEQDAHDHQHRAALEAAAAERAALQSRMEADFAAAHGAYQQQAAAFAKQMEGKLEEEKEKRVAHLQQQAMRRIANAGIASGFSAWQEQWEEVNRKRRMLAAAGARLARPALAAAMALWAGEWREAEQALQAAAVRASLLEKDGEHSAVQVSKLVSRQSIRPR